MRNCPPKLPIRSRPGVRFVACAALGLLLGILPLTAAPIFSHWSQAASAGSILLALAAILRCLTEGFTFEDTRPAQSQLNQDGTYAHCRHPIELSYWLALLGLSLLANSWWVLLTVTAVASVLTIRAISLEESFLAHRHQRVHSIYRKAVPKFGWRLRGTLLTFRATPFCVGRMARNTLVPALTLSAVLPWFVISGKNGSNESGWIGDRFDLAMITIASFAMFALIVTTNPASKTVPPRESRALDKAA